jgi:ubiquinone/menaquinone biosynthesis C-methylase UbiE
LDIGSGDNPFPLATVLLDQFVERTAHRDAALVRDHRPLLLADVHCLPFPDKSFEYVYCSHLLEHVNDPIVVCTEIMRVGRRGFIETPTYAKDILFAWAEGMHKWHVVGIADSLVFFEYSKRQLEGVRSPVWRNFIFSPFYHPLQTVFYENQEVFNTMFSWENGFKVVVFRLDGSMASLGL